MDVPLLGYSAESSLYRPGKGWKGQNEVVPDFLVALSGKTFSGPLRALNLQRRIRPHKAPSYSPSSCIKHSRDWIPNSFGHLPALDLGDITSPLQASVSPSVT